MIAARIPVVAALALLVGCQCRGDGRSAAASEAPPPPVPAPEAAPVPAAPTDRNQGARAVAPLPGRFATAPWLAGAERVAVIGRGAERRVIAGGTGWVRAFRPDGTAVGEARAAGSTHQLEVADLDGDGRDDLIVGRGFGREAREAPASVLVFPGGDLSAPPEQIPLPPTNRAQVVGVAAIPGQTDALWIGAFESKYMVALLEARREDGRWSVRKLDEVRVGLDVTATRVVDGAVELLVARPYGDEPQTDGQVLRWSAAGRAPVPSRRGARAVAVVPGTDGAEIVFTDGWHREYGARAQALISRARRVGDGWATDILVHVRDRHGYDRLRLADTDGDGAYEVLAAGNGPAILVPLAGLPAGAGAPSLGPEDVVDAYPADLDGDGADEVIIAGPTPGIWTRAKAE